MPRTPILTLICLLGWASFASAAWPTDPAGGNVAVCAEAGDLIAPVAVSDGAGGIIVAWEDYRDGAWRVYAQRMNASGDPVWTACGVALCPDQNYQAEPRIVSDDAGGAIVVWKDYRPLNNSDIYAQRISSSGALMWSTSGMAVCAFTGSNDYIKAAADGAGGVLVSWTDERVLRKDIYAQRLSAAGAALWTLHGVAVCTVPQFKLDSAIAPDGAGGAYVVWTDPRGGMAGVYKMYAQRLNAAGNAQWTLNGIEVTPPRTGQGGSLVVPDGSGGVILGYNDSFGTANAYDLWGQHLDAAGTRLWSDDGMPLSRAADWQFSNSMAPDGAGGAVLTWEDYRDQATSGIDVYAQRVDGTGAVLWGTDGVAVCTEVGDQTQARIASDGAGGAVIGWKDLRNGTHSEIYAGRISGAGVPLWDSNGDAICLQPNDQAMPDIVPDGSGGALLAWMDFRNGTDNDVYAQWIDSQGRVGGPTVDVVESTPAAALWLASPAPNPAHHTARMRYGLPRATRVSLAVFDAAGRRVRLLDDGTRGPGVHETSFALRDDGGRTLPAGLYLVRLDAEGRSVTRRILAIP